MAADHAGRHAKGQCFMSARRLPVLLIAIVILASAGFAALASPVNAAQDGPSGEVSFGFWGDPAELNAYEAVVAAFEAANPNVSVEIQHVPGQGDFFARLTTGFAAGDPPDVFLINYRNYSQFAARGVLEPIGPRLRESTVLAEDQFYPGPFEAFTRDGELYCMPQNVSSLVVYYNRDLFEAAGLPLPAAGWTWEEFLVAAKALTVDTNGDGVADQHGLGVEPSLIRFTPFIWQAGGELVDDLDNPTELTIDTPEARAGIEWFIDLSLVHKVVPTEAEVLAEDDESRFMNGTTAMLLQSRRVVPTLREIEGFVWDVAPLPVGQEAAGVLHSDAYCLSSTTEDKDAAWAFIEFANTAEGQTIAAQTGRTVPSMIEVANSAAFLGLRANAEPGSTAPAGALGELAASFDPPASSNVYLDTIPDIRRVPSISTWPEVEEAFNTTLGRAFYGEVSIDNAIALAKSRSEDAFARAAQERGQ
jgi:multiple sugar transport system substrate-binding protein